VVRRNCDSIVTVPSLALALLIVGDLIFIALHLVHVGTDLLPSSRWSIERDRGFGEMFQYLKLAGIGLMLAHLFSKTRMRVLLGWMSVFVFLLLDDMGRIHEHVGLWLASWAHIPSFGPLRGRDVGEIVYSLALASVVVPLLGFGYARGSPTARAISRDLAVLLAALAACGVGVDLVHRLLSGSSANTLAAIVEDGGEMLVLSVTCFYVIQWVSSGAAQHEPDVRFRPGALLQALPRTLQIT
jgi:hypothetical protein